MYAGDPEQLSVRAAFPKLYALEEKYGGLIKGMIRGAKERKQRAEKSKDRSKMFSFTDGMQAFPEAIAKKLGDRVNFGCEVLSVKQKPEKSTYAVFYLQNGKECTCEAECIVFSVPASIAAILVGEYSRGLSKRLNDIYYPPVAEVFLGFHTSQIAAALDGFGFLIPRKEKRQILGTIWSSALFPGRAPEGHVALTTFVGGMRQPELVSRGDNELVSLVIRELADVMRVSGRPVYSKIMRWQRAIPQYTIGYNEVVKAIGRFEEEHYGMYFCANYLGGISVGDCVMSGEKLARRIAAEARVTDSTYNTTQEATV